MWYLIRVAKFSALIIVGIGLLIAVVNTSWFDERLNPDVEDLLDNPAPTISENNGMALLWGFPVASDENAEVAGLDILKQLKNSLSLETWPSPHPAKAIDVRTRESDEMMFEHVKCQPRKGESCNVHIDPSVFQTQRYIELKKRYLKLRERDLFDFGRIGAFHTEIPAYQYPVSVSRLYLAELKQSNNLDEFVSGLTADVTFWRRLLTEDKILLGRMVALACIWYDIYAASELLRSSSLSDENREKLLAAFNPFAKEELDLTGAYQTEITSSYFSLHKTHPDELAKYATSKLMFYIGLQENATVNTLFEKMSSMNQAARQKSPDEFFTLYQEQLNSDKTSDSHNYSIFDIYNWEGKRSFSEYDYNYDYYARLHDLNNMLVLLQAYSELSKLKPSINQSLEGEISKTVRLLKTKNAYTRQSFSYDSKHHMLGFNCLDKSSVCQLRL